MAAACSIALGAGAFAVVAFAADDAEVFTSGSAPVYALEPIADEVANDIDRAAGGGRGSVTVGDLQFCHDAETRGDVDPGCAVMLAAEANGDLAVIPGDRSLVHVVGCGEPTVPGEVAACGPLGEAELIEAAPDYDGGNR